MVFFHVDYIAPHLERRLAVKFSRLARQFLASMKARRDMRRHLERLSGQELRDVGLTRGEVSGYARPMISRDYGELASRHLRTSIGTR